MNVFQVLKPGFLTTVQDLGRYGYLKFGVPVSGAMDTFSMVAGNLLVANNPNDACLEITLLGIEMQALTDTQIAVTGGLIPVKINGENAPMWQTLTVRKGETVSLGKVAKGCRSYLSIRGGINTPIVLGSRSTYVRGKLGGIEGRPLKAGDIIQGFSVPPLRDCFKMPENLVPQFTGNFSVHVVLGPQADMFTEKGIETFLSSSYTVTMESDRMGYRLEGPQIEHRDRAEIVSDALLPGAIQVPGNGKPIIIMKDAQTTGGYPKIAVATTPDLDMLGQAKPNDTVRFFEITLEEAYERFLEYRRKLSGLAEKLIKTN
ncbi:MAG: biotin-dependent carboxyltransferase family protein [Candidatus Bathyarchaeota archaeon]|nr:biotin-dependent carboxyltransferase family protein [Candidatus Bathyarchaeota archaeon]MDW8040230.1 biotin-dependent carboxyltransferase family protein [Nitrososphaerota archaeon]